jgi:maleate isomerase/arylmalonate decarboxylase
MTSPRAYGARARIGLIVPPTNTVNESEWRLAIPEGISFHTHRMPIHTDLDSAEGKAALDADLDAAFAMVLPVAPDVIAYACTAGSMVNPVHGLPHALTERHAVPAVTTSAAIVDALHALGVHRLTVVTPYSDAMNAHEARFLADNGFEVLAISGRGIGAGGPSEFPRIARTPLSDIRQQVDATYAEASEAVVLLCTDFPSLPLITELEDRYGVPVVTSNQATLWACLRTAGVDDAPGVLGRLAACPMPENSK